MGSGASSSTASTPEPPRVNSSRSKSTSNNRIMNEENKGNLVRTNQVAPIIIKNCKEEFQHVVDLKEPIVYGRIADNMPEHAMVKSCCFLVKDVDSTIDKLSTMEQYLAPNMHRCKGGYPIYGLGQPTKDGLENILDSLAEDGYKDILVFNLREEPVLFLKKEFDYVPYTPRIQDNLQQCYTSKGSTAQETSQQEIQIRKDIIDLASLKGDNMFYFYNDLETFEGDPHIHRVAYEDDLAVTDEIYCQPAFSNNSISYLRMCLSRQGAPSEEAIDAFIEMFRNTHSFFDIHDKSVPALIFTCQTGVRRATVGMVMGGLVISHKQGFPQEAKKQAYQINEKSPNLERGEYVTIQRLVKYFKRGLHIKQEVDVIIDLCGQLHNIRTSILDSKDSLETASDEQVIQGTSAKQYYLKQCMMGLECYAYLICLNAYLHEQMHHMFGISFSRWMREQPQLYRILSETNLTEHKASLDLLTSGQRVLVADNFIGLDVLSSQMDVKTSNFRRVAGFPIYGMGQSSREGLLCVTNHLTDKKQGHPSVVVINLRQDMVIECNGATYSLREKTALEDPVIMRGINAQDIEDKEEHLKKEIKTRQNFQIYDEIDGSPEGKEFSSVMTMKDMCEQVKLQGKPLVYHRMPLGDDAAPMERDFEGLMKIVNNLEEIYTDEDGPAMVFQCRTGKGRTTTAMAIAGLIYCHKKGFPFGTKPGEEERVSLPNAAYTKGNYMIVHQLIRHLPNGHQVKREVDFILDMCSDTMTPMHYHMREVIFATYNKLKNAKTEEQKKHLRKRSLQYLERYLYLILFNTYLHCERRTQWQRSFTNWMREVAAKAGVYEILDNLAFTDFEAKACTLKCRRSRWSSSPPRVVRGTFV